MRQRCLSVTSCSQQGSQVLALRVHQPPRRQGAPWGVLKCADAPGEAGRRAQLPTLPWEG